MKVDCIVPKNMIGFSCIGDKCEDTCCIGWQINIDKDTYFKYKHIVNKTVRNEIVGNIDILDKDSNNSYANIKLDNYKCPFLKDGLCSIQNKLGHEYLSHTCKVYPRKVVKIQDLIEVSYTLSCTEVVRRLILDSEPMEFNTETIDLQYKPEYINYNDESMFHKYFWEIRSLAIDIMQCRNIDVTKRIVILGMFLKKISSSFDIEKSIIEYKFIISEPKKIVDELSKLKSPKGYFKSLFKILFDTIKSFISAKQEPFLEAIKPLFEMEYDDIFEEFIEIYKNEYLDFEKNSEYIIENIVVYYIYDSKIPIDINSLTIIDRYNGILLHIFFYRMFIVLHYLKYKNFSFDPTYYIQKIAKMFDHNKMFDVINKKLKSESTDFAHIIPLIIM